MKDLTRRNFLFGSLAAAGMTLAACNNGGGQQGGNEGGSEGEPAPEPEPEPSGNDTPLVVGYSNFSSKFSPFFAETAYDQDAAAMTQIALFPYDRLGQDVYNSIQGETPSTMAPTTPTRAHLTSSSPRTPTAPSTTTSPCATTSSSPMARR